MNSSLTIVIPTLNRLSLAKETLASALAQTADVEIILSDNGSSDGTDDYFRAVDLPTNVRYFHTETTLPAQEHGWFLQAHVQTDWVVFLSDDDLVEPNFAEEIRKLIHENPSIDIAYTAAFMHFGDAWIRGSAGPRVESAADFFQHFLANERNICLCATAFRTEKWRGIGQQPTDRMIGDMYYWVRILADGGAIGCVEAHLSHYYLYRPTIANETGKITVEEWAMESEELADIIVNAILRDKQDPATRREIQRLAARFVSKTTGNQFIWNALRSVRKRELLRALPKLWPVLKHDISGTLRACGTIVLPKPLIEWTVIEKARTRA